MREKTAEDKLREELEGQLSASPKKEKPVRSKPLSVSEPEYVRSGARSRKMERPENVGQRVDSFMEDFEKRVAESLNAGKTQKPKPKRSGLSLPKKSSPEKISVVESAKKVSHKAEGGSVLSDLEEKIEVNMPEVSLTEELPEVKKDAMPEPSLEEPDVQSEPQPQELTTQSEAALEPGKSSLPENVPDEQIVQDESTPDVLPEPEKSSLPENMPDAQVVQDESTPDVLPEPEKSSLPENVPDEQIVQDESSPDVEPEAEKSSLPENMPDAQVVLDESSPEAVHEPEKSSLPENAPDAPVVQDEPTHDVLTEPEKSSLPENVPDEQVVQDESSPEAVPEPEKSSLYENVPDEPVVMDESSPEAVPEPEKSSLPENAPDEQVVQDESSPEAAHEPEKSSPHENVPNEQIMQDESSPDIESEATLEILPEPEHDTSQEELETMQEDIPEIPVELVDEPEQEIEAELPDIPVIDAQVDEQTNELPDIPVIGSDLTEDDEPIDLAQADDDISEFTEEPDDIQSFTPAADLVISVNADIPRIQPEPQEEIDSESESEPVSITMPETTKTAEDKLMADIAEAMTGSPLTLDSNDDTEPYRLPENFFAANHDAFNSSSVPQSAEDKLIANISQAISESPIGIAQDNAHQNLEDDLNPFDEMPVPDPVSSFGLDDEPVELEEDDQPFLPDFSAYQNAEEDNKTLTDRIDDADAASDEEFAADSDNDVFDPFADDSETSESENAEAENDLAPADDDTDNNEDNEMLDPFTIPDLGTDEDEDESAIDEPPAQDLDMLGFTAAPGNPDGDSTETEPDSPSGNEPLTAEDRLAQEIAAFSQQDVHDEENIPSGFDDLPEDNSIDTYSQNEEAGTQNNMPEDSLLTDNGAAPELEDNDDDFDVSSFGDAASIYDEDSDSPQEEFTAPEPEPEEITTSASFIADAGEQKEKEKTMGIRDKLKSRKDGTSSSKAGVFTNILLTLLLIVGGLLLWQLHTLSNKLTLAAMNSGSFEAGAVMDSAPAAYDYAIDFILDPNIPERMAARGREGWQVVGSMRNRDSMTGQPGYEFIFMRRVTGR